jgi:segregation and condensation protein B
MATIEDSGADAAPEPTAAELDAELGASEAQSEAPEVIAEPSSDASAEASDKTGATDATGAESDAEQAPEAPEEPVEALTEEDAAALARVVFSLLFASPDPLSVARLKDLTESPLAHVRVALEALGHQLDHSGLPLVLKEIAGGFRLFSSPEVASIVQRLAKVRKAEKVTPAALETLAIVAYRQPTTKAEVEAIRGVQAGPMLRTLIDRGLVKVAGRADQPGSPLLYATTRDFLDRFGLASLKELPRDNELAR